MAQLAATNSGERSRDAQFDLILDSIATLVVQLDDNLNIFRMNAAARRHFQLSDTESRSATFSTLVQDSVHEFLYDICRRVRDTGNTETFEVDSLLYPGRTLYMQIIKAPSGLVVTADVVSQTVQVRRTYAAAAAAASAVDITNLLGRGRINIRGTVTSANQTLAMLAGTTIEKIMGLRLASLFEQESRDAVRDAIESMLTDGESFSIDATLLGGTATRMRVTLGAGVERDSGSISGAAFMVIERG